MVVRGNAGNNSSPVLRLFRDVHREVAERDLDVQDTRHRVGYQEIGRPWPSTLGARQNETNKRAGNAVVEVSDDTYAPNFHIVTALLSAIGLKKHVWQDEQEAHRE